MEKDIRSIVKHALDKRFVTETRNDDEFCFSAKGKKSPRVNGSFDDEDERIVFQVQMGGIHSRGLRRFKEFSDEGAVRDEMGALFEFNNSLVWQAILSTEALLNSDKVDEVMVNLLKYLMTKAAERMEWIEEKLLGMTYQDFMDEKVAMDTRFSFNDLGERMIFVYDNLSKSKYLLNGESKRVLQLVSPGGHVTAFTVKDLERSVITRDVDSTNARDMMARYRFWVYDYQGGRAEVEWMIVPDGRYFADEDGFGAEDCQELIVSAMIDKQGKIIKKFRPLFRCG